MNPIQLFNPADRSFTYVVVDETSREALFIDPSSVERERDLSIVRQRNLRVRWCLATAGTDEADGAAAALAALLDARGPHELDWPEEGSALIRLGRAQQLQIVRTPGVTAQACCVYWVAKPSAEEAQAEREEASSVAANAPLGHELRPDLRHDKRHVFTGLSLLIGEASTVQTAQGGDARTWQDSVRREILSLPPTTIVWPGRDDHQRTQSTVALEKSMNPGFQAGATTPARVSGNAAAATEVQMGESLAELPSTVQPAEGYAGDVSPHLAHAWWQAGDAVLVDVRSDAERAWVGFVPGAAAVAWKQWPGMAENPDFDRALRELVPVGQRVVLLCRSGVRSIAAARRATAMGLEAYNILEGFEGGLDEQGQRGHMGGWRGRGLPWQQS